MERREALIESIDVILQLTDLVQGDGVTRMARGLLSRQFGAQGEKFALHAGHHSILGSR
jgi:hypothetical protein